MSIIPPEYADESLPSGFLEDQIILPSFYQPETDALRWATHQNIRRTLFYSLFRDIKYCEYKRVKSGNFQMGEI